jgi:hypothetical protein
MMRNGEIVSETWYFRNGFEAVESGDLVEDGELGNAEEILRRDREIREWEELWGKLVAEMTKVTKFPALMVDSPDSARCALELLVKEVCEIAASPKDSQEYRDLEHHMSLERKKRVSLKHENSVLKEIVSRISELYDNRISRIAVRIARCERRALVLEEAKEHSGITKEGSLQKICQNFNENVKPVKRKRIRKKKGGETVDLDNYIGGSADFDFDQLKDDELGAVIDRYLGKDFRKKKYGERAVGINLTASKRPPWKS